MCKQLWDFEFHYKHIVWIGMQSSHIGVIRKKTSKKRVDRSLAFDQRHHLIKSDTWQDKFMSQRANHLWCWLRGSNKWKLPPHCTKTSHHNQTLWRNVDAPPTSTPPLAFDVIIFSLFLVEKKPIPISKRKIPQQMRVPRNKASRHSTKVMFF